MTSSVATLHVSTSTLMIGRGQISRTGGNDMSSTKSGTYMRSRFGIKLHVKRQRLVTSSNISRQNVDNVYLSSLRRSARTSNRLSTRCLSNLKSCFCAHLQTTVVTVHLHPLSIVATIKAPHLAVATPTPGKGRVPELRSKNIEYLP